MGQKMVTQSGAGSVSFNGVEYPVVDGVVDVPGEAAVELLAHGFDYAPIELTDEQKSAAAAEEKARKEAEEFAALEAEEAAAEEKSAKGK